MRRKFLSVLICLVLLIPTISLFQPKRAHAFAALARVAVGSVGERVLIGMAEKAGMKLATKSAREKAIQRWNLDAYERWQADEAAGRNAELWDSYAQIIDLSQNEVTPIPNKPGWGKVAVDTLLFLTGADIFFDVYNAFKQGYDSGTPVDMYSNLGDVASMGALSIQTTAGNFRTEVTYSSYTGQYNLWFFNPTYPTGEVPFKSSFPFTPFLKYESGNVVVGAKNVNGQIVYTKNYPVPLASGDPVNYSVPITEQPIIEVPQPLQPLWDNTATPEELAQTEGMPDVVEIEIPLDEVVSDPVQDPYGNPEPWNEPFTLPQSNPNPDPESEPSPESGEDLPKANPDDHANRWKQLVTTKFPFSLPWDLYAILSVLNAEPQKPVLKLDATGRIAGVTVPLKFTQNIDFLDPYMPFLRTFILIGYVLFLIFSTRKLLGGGQ
jgi:hypothetical protein